MAMILPDETGWACINEVEHLENNSCSKTKHKYATQLILRLKTNLVIEFQIPLFSLSSLSKSMPSLSGFLLTLSLTMLERRELMTTLISVDFRGVSLPS